MKEQMRRMSFLKAAGLVRVSSVAAASVPGLLPSLNALAQEANNEDLHHLGQLGPGKLVVASLPRMDTTAAGTFDPDAGWVKGGAATSCCSIRTPPHLRP
jgi:hypothetical protein